MAGRFDRLNDRQQFISILCRSPPKDWLSEQKDFISEQKDFISE
jgi:hypothetical protein